MLKNEWTESWARDDTPDPLGMPLQGMVTFDAVRRTHRYAGVAQTQDVAFKPVGQVAGLMNESRRGRQVIYDLVTDYVEAVERTGSLLPEA